MIAIHSVFINGVKYVPENQKIIGVISSVQRKNEIVSENGIFSISKTKRFMDISLVNGDEFTVEINEKQYEKIINVASCVYTD